MQNKMFGRTEQQQPPSEPPSGSATAGIVGGPGSRSGPTMMSTAGRKLSSAALRRELWRETPQQPLEDTTNPGTCANVSITRIPSSKTSTTTMSNSNNAAADNKITATGDQVFKFDSFDRDRYLSGSSDSLWETRRRSSIQQQKHRKTIHKKQHCYTYQSIIPTWQTVVCSQVRKLWVRLCRNRLRCISRMVSQSTGRAHSRGGL